MKRFTKLFMTLAMLFGAIGGVSSVKAEKRNLEFKTEGYCTASWNSSTNTFSWGSGGVNNPAWTFMIVKDLSGDLSSWETLHLKLTDFTNAKSQTLTIYFKENKGDTRSMDWVTSATLTPNENGDVVLDLKNFDWKNVDPSKGTIDKTNIVDVTIYGGERTNPAMDGSVKVTDAYLEKPDPDCSVKYVVKDANGNILLNSTSQDALSGTHITTLPNEFKRGFCEYTSADVTLEKDTETTVEFTATWNDCPIKFYADYNSIVWKYLHLSRTNQWYLNNDPTPCLVGDPSDNDLIADSYQWGFVGNPYQYKIYNKAAGSSKTLNQSAAMAEGETIWTSVAKNGEGILFGRASDGQFLNQAGGEPNTSLGFWGDASDAGSTFFVADVPEPSLIIGDAGWATFGSLDKSANLSNATNVYAAKYDNGSVKLTAVESKSVPAGVGVLVEGSGEIVPTFDVEAGSVDSDLKVSNGTVAGNGSIYVLANGSHDVGFYLLAEGVKIPAGKAYLEVNAGGREFIGFGGATGIKSVETVKANGTVYNLAGQQVKSAQKGVFIVNGKKVIK